MSTDPIVDEVRKTREELAAEQEFDLGRIIEAARSRQGADGRQVIALEESHREHP